MKKLIKKLSLFVCLAIASFSFNVLLIQAPRTFAADSQVQEKDLGASGNREEAPSTSDASMQSGQQKGGIFKVGRAFKTAGRTTKKGFAKVGNAFKWFGGKVKRTFTGETSENQTAENTAIQNTKGSQLDRVGEEPEKTATDASN